MYHFIRAFAADRISAVVLTDFSREAAKANKRDRMQWTKNSISSELRGFAPSRETVFCANLQRVQEK